MLFMNWLTDLIGGLGSVINGLLTWLFFLIGKWLYPFISYLYTLFEILVKGRLLDNDIMRTLSTRIGLLLGIVMFFIIIVNVIQMLVDPDKSNDKEKGAGGILFRVVIVLIMFGFSSFAFNSLYYIQKVVVDSNVIGRIFVPSDIKTNDFGDYLSYKLFLSFYTINPEADPDDAMVNTCKTNMEQMQLDIYNNKDYSLAQYCLDKRDSNDVEIIKFNAILAIGAAIFCIYFLFSYCITIGVRMILLTFLEIISPMAFVSYLSPKKDNMFSKWLKLYFSTFIDSFIRIAIIHFAIYMIYLVLGDLSDGSAFASTVMDNQFVNGNDDTKVFIYTIMVFAILTFAKKAPDLIKDLFPSSSKLGFGVPTTKQLFDGMLGGNLVRGGMIGAAGLGIGAAIGGVGNAARGYIGAEKGWKNKLMGIGGGLVGGLASGGLAGAKAKGIGKAFGASNKAAMAQNKRIVDWREAGGVSTWGRLGTGLQQRLGLMTKADRLDLAKTDIEAENAVYNQFSGYFDAAKGRAEKKILEGKLAGKSVNADAALDASRRMEILKAQAGNLDKSDARFQTKNTTTGNMEFDQSKYDAELNGILKAIDAQQERYNNAMKDATRDYFAQAIADSTFDAVINQNMDMAQAVLDNNRNYASLAGLNVSDFDTFDKSNNAVKNAVTDNTVKLSQNQRAGKTARADAKYSGVDKK